MLHITNGDVVAEKLRRAGLPGEVATTADVLHEGPCPTAASPAEFREVRARYLASDGFAPYDEALEALVRADAALDESRAHDEVVLWFEHDLFDQLLLVRVLAWFARYGTGAASLRLLCIGRYPGIQRFVGLGQLSPDQLRGLFADREAVTATQLDLADRAWAAFGEPDPTRFAAFMREDAALPFLAGAVRRQLQELPWVRNGLSRTEHQALAATAAGAPDLPELFRSAQEMEDRVFLGDTSFYRTVRRLAAAPLPLLRLTPPGDRILPSRQAASLTALGERVLAGEADHAAVNGVDRWIGGVHLQGRSPRWRWDQATGTVVAR